jgi:hypothetical protein
MISTDVEEMCRNLETLNSRLDKDIRGVWEVYASKDRRSLVYRPIALMKCEEILAGRIALTNQGNLTLIAVEVARERIQDYDPENTRRRGAFRVTEWLTPVLKPMVAPEDLRNIKKRLDKKSGWSKGGPQQETNGY